MSKGHLVGVALIVLAFFIGFILYLTTDVIETVVAAVSTPYGMFVLLVLFLFFVYAVVKG